MISESSPARVSRPGNDAVEKALRRAYWSYMDRIDALHHDPSGPDSTDEVEHAFKRARMERHMKMLAAELHRRGIASR